MINIGFVGLGNMGGPMVRNLAVAGHKIQAFDVSEQARLRLEDQSNVVLTTSIAEAANSADVIITMLPDNEPVRQVVLGEGGIAMNAAAGSVVVDMSSISPLVAQELNLALHERSVAFADAPVSGGTQGAEAGNLTIMVGAEKHIYQQLKPLLSALGSNIVHAGKPGMGQIFKLCNQIVVAGNLTMIAEALALCSAGGGDPDKMIEALKGGAAGSWMLDNLAPKMLAGDDVGFPIDLQLKDLRLVGEAAHALNVPLPATGIATALNLAARAGGGANDGNQTIYKVLAQLAGQTPELIDSD